MTATPVPRPRPPLLIKSPEPRPGYTPIACPGSAPLRWLSVGMLRLDWSICCYESTSGPAELVLDIFGGRSKVTVCEAGGNSVYAAGGRADAFGGPPAMLYIPPGCEYSIKCESDEMNAIVFSAPAAAGRGGAVLVPPEQAEVQEVGRDNWSRCVMTGVGNSVPAQRLIVGETLNPPGHWSSSPPHKHDSAQSPAEAVMEEVYHFQLQPRQGFGFIRVYTAPGDPEPLDEAMVIEDGDTVLIPRGYHPVVAGPGYRLHYTWALAGEERRYGAWSDDPRHAWIKL
jgi:5-deoxy-glucuronate isomerase